MDFPRCPICGLDFKGCTALRCSGCLFIKKRWFDIETLISILDYTAIGGINIILVSHLNLGVLDIAVFGMCSGWLMTYIVRNKWE